MARRSPKKNGKPAGVAPPQKAFTGDCDWIWGLLLVLAVLLVYQPVWYAGYIWDDDAVVTNNPVIIGPLGLKEIWTTSAADICPLTLTTFWLEHQLWGATALPYHLVNVFLHAACAVLLWRVLRALCIPGAFIGAAMWALHPVQVESVAWISEMKNTESGLFYLLAILFFLRDIRVPNGTINYALTLVFAGLAMASKSSTVILPVIFCLCAWWLEGRWNWRSVIKTAPIFLMSIAAGIVSMWTQQIQGASDALWLRSLPERLAGAGDGVWFYLGKLLWPYPLLTLYPRWHFDLGDLFSYFPLLAVFGVLALLWCFRNSWARPWLFAFAYFVVALLPVLGLLNNYIFRYATVFDHFQYLASMGPLSLVGAGMIRFAERFLPEKAGLQKVAATIALLVPATLSWNQARVYESSMTLWEHTLAGNPNSAEAYNDLGILLEQNGETDKAITYYEKALDVDPNHPEAHYNLGLTYSRQGRVDEAIAEYQKAVDLYPDYPNAQNNLAILLVQKGRLDDAISHCQKVVEYNPDDAQAHATLAVILAQEGRTQEAQAQFQATLKVAPNDAEVHGNFGTFLSNQGRFDEAIVELQKSLKISPATAQVHNSLGYALMQKGQVDAAIEEFQQALSLQPDYANAQTNLTRAQSLATQKAGK